MFYLVKVLIGRSSASLDRLFSYYTLDENLHAGERVIVSFGQSKETMAFVMEEPVKIEKTIQEYIKENGLKSLSKINRRVDDEPLLNEKLMSLAKKMAEYYKSDLIQILSSFLPPSLKPRNSALNKTQSKTIDYVFSLDTFSGILTKNEQKLYEKIRVEKDGIRRSEISAKASLKSLLDKKAVEIRPIPVSRIPEMEAKKYQEIQLTDEQRNAYDCILSTDKRTILLQGVTGSGKTEVYLKLVKQYLKEGKGVLVLLPEITLTDHMADVFYSHFKNVISILNSSLSDGRKYDEYKRIVSGETKVVLGTRSAVFAPIENLGLIIIDEEHSDSYKQENSPFYSAIEVSKMRSEIEGCKVLLGSATPRIIDKARAEKEIYLPVYMNRRYAKNQEHDLILVDMNNSANLNLRVSSLFSTRLIKEIKKTMDRKEQAMILLNRRGYSPIYLCRKCQHVLKCPNCNIPLNYHRSQGILSCHHCGYKMDIYHLHCPNCNGSDFSELGYGTERACDELKMLFPGNKIARLDSDITSNDIRHQILQDFASGNNDILIGTQVIAKGLDFPKVTLAGMLDCDFTLGLPTYRANEETFDLISQFVGRTGRALKKGRVLLQSFAIDNKVIQMAAKQDYEGFYHYEMEERRKYQYPPYTYLCIISIKSLKQERCSEVSNQVSDYLKDNVGKKRINIYGPSIPYIPYQNGRYCRNILLKYKSFEEVSPLLDGIRVFRISNKDSEISIDVDPGKESL